MFQKRPRLVTLTILGLFLIQVACQTLTGPRPTPPAPVS